VRSGDHCLFLRETIERSLLKLPEGTQTRPTDANFRSAPLSLKVLWTQGSATDGVLQTNKGKQSQRKTEYRSKSDEGKAQSRMNALKHGFSSQEIVLEGESADQFDALRAQLEAEFDSNSVVERELVDHLAGSLWRLRRVPVFEAGLIRARRDATKRVYTYTITEEGLRDINRFLDMTFGPELADLDKPEGKPGGAHHAA
jgi:hypothetical protein